MRQAIRYRSGEVGPVKVSRFEILKPRGGQAGGPEMELGVSFRGEREPDELGGSRDQKKKERGGDENFDQAEPLLFRCHFSDPRLTPMPKMCHDLEARALGEIGALLSCHVNRRIKIGDYWIN
jgi:hypothetical protein